MAFVVVASFVVVVSFVVVFVQGEGHVVVVFDKVVLESINSNNI